MAYKLSLVARNEGLEYVDDGGVYRFEVSLSKGLWTIYLPASCGDALEVRDLGDEERGRILPRVTEYLAKLRWLGMFARTYRVQVIERAHGLHET
ncbi:hypothetical protein [Dyella sp. 2RAB6]|uniref:hypothetical protein n=1 Tax=Dyella sp. 2RAB6 TaxID=3232992 RepID=UPI003F8F6771